MDCKQYQMSLSMWKQFTHAPVSEGDRLYKQWLKFNAELSGKQETYSPSIDGTQIACKHGVVGHCHRCMRVRKEIEG